MYIVEIILVSIFINKIFIKEIFTNLSFKNYKLLSYFFNLAVFDVWGLNLFLFLRILLIEIDFDG